MKKTFAAIALAFVATTAYAEDAVDLETKVLDINVAVTDWQWDNGKATPPTGAFSFDVSNDWKIDLTFTATASSGANNWGTCVLATGASPTANFYSDGFQLYLQAGGGLTIKAGSAGSISDSTNHFLATGGTMSASDTYTVSLVHIGTVLWGTVFNSAGEKIADQTWEDVKWTEGTTVTQFCTNISPDMVENKGWKRPTVTVKSAPEPATATLGLLALAGLAARRRRK